MNPVSSLKMASTNSNEVIQPFAITTPRLIIVPTPIAVSVKPYRQLYAELHADASFCEMGFGSHFPVRNWTDDETRDVIQTRDIGRSWRRYAIGDFAVGLRGPVQSDQAPSQSYIIEGENFDALAGSNLEHFAGIEWVGYAGIRDASTTSLPPREAGDPALPPWQEMVEIRYGVSPKFWGKGMAKEAAEAVMRWSVERRGVKRFIAETERDNKRSARLLEKLGFVNSGTDYWKEPSEIEWELIVQ
jgi:RimJ/RimL family protein N-acetyltransferase